MSEAREVIASQLRNDLVNIDARLYYADSILSALKEAGWVVVSTDKMENLELALAAYKICLKEAEEGRPEEYLR